MPYVAHQPGDVFAAYGRARQRQLVMQHAGAGERLIKVQLFELAQQSRVGGADRTWQAAHAAVTDAGGLGLLRYPGSPHKLRPSVAPTNSGSARGSP